MKNLRTRQAKALGALGALGAIVCGVLMALANAEIATMILLGCAFAYFLLLAFKGLSAKALKLDGDDIVIPTGRDFQRIGLHEVLSIRTFPIFRYVAAITLKLRDGKTLRTIVADQDLTWIMSLMPTAAITPYWRRRTGQQDSTFR